MPGSRSLAPELAGLAAAALVALLLSFAIHDARVSADGDRPPLRVSTSSATPAPVEPAPAAPAAAAPATLAPAPVVAQAAVPAVAAPVTGTKRQPAGTGRVTVRSTPRGVVYIDDAPIGTTPQLDIDLGVGTHTIEVHLGGHETASRTVRITSGQVEDLDFQLRPAAASPGALTIRSTPPSVVYVDDEPVGTTPIEGLEVPAGLHVVELKLGGHAPVRREVQVRAGVTAQVVVDLSASSN